MSVNLTEVLTKALEPHKDTLLNWEIEDVGLLFMGFGNISIYPSEVSDPNNEETYSDSDDIGGTFADNSIAIADALNNLGVDLSKNDWDSSDIYWLIHSYSGEVRSDLVNALEQVGYSCYNWFDSENLEGLEGGPEKVVVWESEPSL